jgi:ribosome-associated protein
MTDAMRINDDITIDESEFEERFVRSSGPGGQNVNKVSTAVELRFALSANTSIPPRAKARLVKLAGRRLTLEGVLIIQADQFRTQEMNRADARKRLKALIVEALIEPKVRIKTRPTKGSNERRIKAKATRSEVKKGRGRARSWDD